MTTTNRTTPAADPRGGRRLDTLECATARTLQREEAQGAALELDAGAALRAHLDACAACQADWTLDHVLPLRGAWDSGPALPLTDAGAQRMVDAVVSGARGASVRAIPTRRVERRWKAWTFGAAAFAAAAAVAWILVPRWLAPVGPPPPATAGGPFLARAVVGAVQADGLAIQAGAALAAGADVTTGPAGRLAITLTDGTTLHVGPESRLRLPGDPAAAAGDVVIHLREGRLLATVTHQPEGRHVVVATPVGAVQVVGTAFTVEVEDDGAEVRVLEGVVAVRDGDAVDAPPRTVRARHATLVGNRGAKVRRLSQAEARADVGLLLDDPGRAASLSEQVAARGRVRTHGATVRPGNAETTDEPGAADGAVAGAVDGAPTAANRWLREARRLRAARDWPGAAAAYRALFADAPGSAEARAARVSFGDLLLEHLGDARAALDAFDAYLGAAPNGALAEEALWGRARSLRSLGRTSDERAALGQIVTRFPTSGVGARARARLTEIE